MKNKQHQYILKAYLESKIPAIIRKTSHELILFDSVIAGYCTRLINGEKHIKLPTNEFVSKDDKLLFSELISHSTGVEKEELIIYYRLVILVESILNQYRH